MRQIGAVLLVLALSGCQSQGLKVSDEVSTSGLSYSLIQMPGNSRVSIQIAWPSYWAFSKAKNQAVPYIGARLLLAGGAEEYPAGEVVERFADMKSEGNLAPSADYVLGVLHYSREHQDETLKMANAHLRKPSLDERWFNRIRDEFSKQIEETRTQAESKGFEALRWAVFGKQAIRAALSLDEVGMIDDVKQSDVATWSKKVITRSASIVIAGDLTEEEAGGVIDTLFEGLLEANVERELSVEADFSPRRILLHTPKSTTSTLSFVGKLPSFREGSEFEDLLLNSALGTGSQSVLFDVVRTKMRASYVYGSGIDAFSRNHRILVLSGQVETSKLAEVEKAIREAYAKFREEGPSGGLQQLKEHFRENIKESLKDTGAMAHSAMMAKLDGQKTASILTLQDELNAVTVQSLKQRLNVDFPTADGFIVVVSSPDETALPDACVIKTPKQAVGC